MSYPSFLSDKLLEDEHRKWFALFLIAQAKHLPEVLFPALIRAAVYENDASLNGWFVAIASRFGSCRVAKALFDYAGYGTNIECEHALHAVYWVLAYPVNEEKQDLLVLLRDIALNLEYSDRIRDKARRYYEATTQQSFEA